MLPNNTIHWNDIVTRSVLSATIEGSTFDRIDYVHQLSVILTYRFAANPYPVYVVEPELLWLILHTEVSESIDLPEVVPCSLIVLPRNHIFDPDNLSVDYIYVSQGNLLLPEDTLSIDGIKINESLIPESDKSSYLTFVYQGEKSVYAQRKKIQSKRTEPGPENATDTTVGELSDKDVAFNKLLQKIIIQLFLIIATMPDAVEPQRCLSTSGSLPQKTKSNRSQNVKTAVWKPNYLKRPHTLKPKSILVQRRNSHRSPRTHWRKGHWRRVLFGPRSQPQYRWHWIKPTLINPYYPQPDSISINNQ